MYNIIMYITHKNGKEINKNDFSMKIGAHSPLPIKRALTEIPLYTVHTLVHIHSDA